MQLTSQTIQKYNKYKTTQLRKKAGEIFRKWIRERDKGNRCISCNNPSPNQAGHYYSAGHYPVLEFNEDNVHLQCLQCNYFKGSNALEYRKKLITKIGEQRVNELDLIVSKSKQEVYKHDRFRLIEIIETYK